MTKYLVPLLLILLIGCDDSKPLKPTYFGGKIINPKASYVTLSDNYNFNDTIYLKKDNSFLGTYKNLKKGLYIFGHGPEHQYVYLEPKDSLLFRLNTWNFDESLVFSGKNAARNNILIESFLQSEEDKKNFAQFYTLTQHAFLNKIDSLKNSKLNNIENYRNNNENVSDDFINILNISSLYPVYTYLEQYALHNFKKEKPQTLANTYFNYRNEIDSKKDSLIFFGPYYRFIIDKVYNDAYLKNKKSPNFTVDLLESINVNITSESIKNRLMYNTVIRRFFKNPNQKENTQPFFTFFKLNSNIDQKKNVQRLANDLKLLNTTDKLPAFNLINAKGEEKCILDITKGKNAVLLFKDYEYTSDEWIASRINYLIKKNPDITFVIINLCSNSKEYTKNIAIKHQYTLPKKSTVCEFSSSKFPRVVLIDNKGIIKNGYTSLSSKNINFEVRNLQKNK